MNYKESFENFWNEKGRYLGVNNPDRTCKDIGEALSKCNRTIDIDNYVCGLKSRKETNRRIIVAYFDYLEKETGRKMSSSLYEKKFYDYPFERQLEIAKYLHEPHTLAEIEEHFDIDERTRRKDIDALENGIKVLGSTIKIEPTRENRRDCYRTTVHPIFLPLNLTEVYALTVYLNQAIDDGDPNKKIILGLTDRIKSQLSDYAYKKLFPDEEPLSIRNDYIDDEKLAKQREGILMYLMKSGQRCSFFWEEKEYYGTITYNDNGKYVIRLENGEYLDADINEVEFVIDSLEYE